MTDLFDNRPIRYENDRLSRSRRVISLMSFSYARADSRSAARNAPTRAIAPRQSTPPIKNGK